MQDLFQKYVVDLYALRDAFHDELTAQAQELSKAMGIYARGSQSALSLFMEKVSARGAELEGPDPPPTTLSTAAGADGFAGLAGGGPLVEALENCIQRVRCGEALEMLIVNDRKISWRGARTTSFAKVVARPG